MKKSKNIQNFDRAYKKYFSEKDPGSHREALEILMESVGLDGVFNYYLEEEGELERFFLTWEEAGKSEKDPKDRKGMKEIGKRSKEFYNKKKYKDLFELFFDIMLSGFVDSFGLKNRKDFENLTDHDLYKKEIIPSEIFLQFFLVESAVKNPEFDWGRNDTVMRQNLACLVACFEDIFEFMGE